MKTSEREKISRRMFISAYKRDWKAYAENCAKLIYSEKISEKGARIEKK